MWRKWCVQAVDCAPNPLVSHARPDERVAEVALHLITTSLVEKVAIVDCHEVCHTLGACFLCVSVELADPFHNLRGTLSNPHRPGQRGVVNEVQLLLLERLLDRGPSLR